MASDHLIVVEKIADFRWADADSRVVTAEEFISERGDADPDARKRPRKVINLCRSYDYLSLGYYCSLLAEARGDRVTPSVETILDLQHRNSQQASLARLDRLIAGAGRRAALGQHVELSRLLRPHRRPRTGRAGAQGLRAVPLPAAARSNSSAPRG